MNVGHQNRFGHDCSYHPFLLLVLDFLLKLTLTIMYLISIVRERLNQML